MNIKCFQAELSSICNYKCTKCPRSHITRETGFMNIELLKKILKSVKKYKSFINFSFFGEPLLHPKFPEILDMTKDYPVVINSNMSLMTKEIMHKFIEVGINQLRVSIDAATLETYNKVRPSKNLKDMIREDRLNIIEDKVRYWHSLKNRPSTRHVYPVSSLNYHEVDMYVDKWQPLLEPQDEILIKSILSYGGRIKDDIISPNRCNIWNQGVVTIDWQGNISPCNLDIDMKLRIGNINDKTIEEIWEGHEYQRMMRLSLKKKITPCNICIDSNNWSKNLKIVKDKKWNYNRFKAIYGRNL